MPALFSSDDSCASRDALPPFPLDDSNSKRQLKYDAPTRICHDATDPKTTTLINIVATVCVAITNYLIAQNRTSLFVKSSCTGEVAVAHSI